MKGTFVQGKVNARVLYRKLSKLDFATARIGNNAVGTLARMGKSMAKTIAPNYSSRTASLIMIRKKGTPQGIRQQIIARNPTNGNNGRLHPGGTYSNFNLVRWMHTTKGVFQTRNPFGPAGKKHIRSGDPQFMYTTRRYLNKMKKGIAKGRHRKINLV